MDRFTIKEAYQDYSKKGKKKERVSFKDYKRIVYEFIKMYIYDLFFLDREIYFFLGGKAVINKCGNWVRKVKVNNSSDKEYRTSRNSVGIYWYHRPFPRAFHFKLRKMVGSTNAFPKIQKEWMKNNDVSLLMRYTQIRKLPRFEQAIYNRKFEKK